MPIVFQGGSVFVTGWIGQRIGKIPRTASSLEGWRGSHFARLSPHPKKKKKKKKKTRERAWYRFTRDIAAWCLCTNKLSNVTHKSGQEFVTTTRFFLLFSYVGALNCGCDFFYFIRQPSLLSNFAEVSPTKLQLTFTGVTLKVYRNEEMGNEEMRKWGNGKQTADILLLQSSKEGQCPYMHSPRAWQLAPKGYATALHSV